MISSDPNDPPPVKRRRVARRASVAEPMSSSLEVEGVDEGQEVERTAVLRLRVHKKAQPPPQAEDSDVNDNDFGTAM